MKHLCKKEKAIVIFAISTTSCIHYLFMQMNIIQYYTENWVLKKMTEFFRQLICFIPPPPPPPPPLPKCYSLHDYTFSIMDTIEHNGYISTLKVHIPPLTKFRPETPCGVKRSHAKNFRNRNCDFPTIKLF